LFTSLFTIALWLLQPAAPAPDLFDQLVAKGKAQQETIRTIGARFTETTVSSLLTKPLVATGTVVAEKTGRIVMQYETPERKTVTVGAERLVITWADPSRKPEQLNIAQVQKRVQKYFAHATPGELRGSFVIHAEADPAMPSAYQVDMRPKRKQIAEGLERLQLWIDKDTTLLVRMRMTFPGGDSKTIALDDVRTNVPFEPGAGR
jgi:outer membrane lipoprotein-sorting protein